MRLSLTLLAPTLMCLQVNAWIGLLQSEKTNTSHCFTTAHDLGAMDENERVRIKNMCAEAVCQEDRFIKLTGCAPIMAEPPCYVETGDMNKPFPQCCYEIRCDNNNEVGHNEAE